MFPFPFEVKIEKIVFSVNVLLVISGKVLILPLNPLVHPFELSLICLSGPENPLIVTI